ncbi:MAG: molecular chaperone DnaJ [Actinobacteria bacterium]|nr:molecular chaperone DnaJ [Actinomycetota bacterium]
MSKDYYNILGINKSASQDEVKKAFRKKAHEFHPDKKGGDEARFKEANEAYQVLGNEKKRAQYDQFGSSFEQAGARGGSHGFEGFGDFSEGFNVNMDDIGDIFGGVGDIFGFGGARGGTRAKRGADIQVSLTIEFNEAVFGSEKEIRLNKTVQCDKCKGNGAEPGSKIETCKTCGGKGQIMRVQRTILGNMQVRMTCSDCGGEGKAYSQKCTKCRGAGAVKEVATIKVKIPAGIDDGGVIRLTGQGEAGQKGAPGGDLYLQIRVKKDARFERVGSDIISKLNISFTQAALGDKIEVNTIDGPVKLKIPEGTQSETNFRLRGKGVPHIQGRGPFGGAQGKRGDHIVKVKVSTPKNLNRKQKQLLKELNI